MYENDNEKIQKVRDELNQKIELARKELELESKAISREFEYLGQQRDEKEEIKHWNEDRKKIKTTKIRLVAIGIILGCTFTLAGSKYVGSKIIDTKVEKAKEEFEDTRKIPVACVKIKANPGESPSKFNERVSKYFHKIISVDTSSTFGVLYIDRGYPIYNVKLNEQDSNFLRSLTYIYHTTDSEALKAYLEKIFEHEFTMTEQGNLDWNPIVIEMNKICINENLPLYRVSENGELLTDGEKVPELDMEHNVLATGKKDNLKENTDNLNKVDTLEQLDSKETKKDNLKQNDNYFTFTTPDEWFFSEESSDTNDFVIKTKQQK